MRTPFGSPTRTVTTWIRESRERRARVNARLAEVDGLSRLDRWDRGSNRPPMPISFPHVPACVVASGATMWFRAVQIRQPER
jgi:hypothetical protein